MFQSENEVQLHVLDCFAALLLKKLILGLLIEPP